MEGEGDLIMVIKTNMSQAIEEFLKTDLLINQNILGIIENLPELQIYVDNAKTPKGVFVQNGYMNYLYSKKENFIDEVANTFFKDGDYGFSAIEMEITEKMKGKYEVVWENPCTLYYLPKENLKLNEIKNQVQNVDIKDAEIINKYYQFRNSISIEAIKKDILNRPSSAIYVNGQIVCWVLMHNDNSMGIMYTKEEHRGKGYAMDVTTDLASKIIKSGKIPFLTIIKNNTMSPGLVKKCGFIKCGYVSWMGIIVGNKIK